MSLPIRPERSFEQFSRSAELVRAIKKMWRDNEKILEWPTSTIIERRINGILLDFDLSLKEWYYWAKIARAEMKA